MHRLSLPYVLPLMLLLLLSPCAVTAQEAGSDSAPEIGAAEPAPAASVPAGGDDANAMQESGRISLVKVIEWGGAIGYFIIFLSVITVMLVVFHLLLYRRSKLWPKAVRMEIGSLFAEKKMDEIKEYCEIDNSLLSRVIAGALRRMHGGHVEMEQAMNDSAETEVLRLQQTVGYFSLIAAIAPLCGLLGTVVGMIAAFNEIASRGVVTPRELADPIQKALVTTCFGLIVAIPNVVAFTFFRDYLHRLLADLGVLLEELVMAGKGVVPEWLKNAPAEEAAAVSAAEGSSIARDDDDDDDEDDDD